MAQIQRIKTGDTNWGDEATKLNTNFNQLNQNKVEAVPGSRLITEEEAQKLNDLQNLEQPNLNETDPSSFAYVKGQEKIQLIMKAQELQNPPISSTLTYQVNSETFSYKIGQFVRAIVDGEPKIYQLYNIVNGSAVWKEVNTGSGGGGEVSGYAEGFSWYELTNPEVVATINMKAYTTLTGISKLNDMVIEGQNQSATFRISIIPTYANRYNPFTVQSLNPDIASVRASGADTYTVTSVGLGTTQILVTNGPISEQFDVTVQRANIAVKKITLSEQNKSMLVDDEFTLTATVEPTDATEEIDWSVIPSDLLAVSYPNNKTANITALLNVGTATVSAANKDRSSIATCIIQCSGGISVVSLNFQPVQGSHNYCVVSILKYPNKTARENSRDEYGDFTPTSQSTWIIQNSTESTVMSVTIFGEECLGINQTASRAIWKIDGVAQSGRTGTVDCDNELHSIQFNGG